MSTFDLGTIIMPKTLPYVATCERCKCDYKAYSYNSKYCVKCKAPAKLEMQQEARKHSQPRNPTCPVCGKEYKRISNNKWCPECAPAQKRIRRKVYAAEWRKAKGQYDKGYVPPDECWWMLIGKMIANCRGNEDCGTCTVKHWCDRSGEIELRGDVPTKDLHGIKAKKRYAFESMSDSIIRVGQGKHDSTYRINRGK